MEVRCDVKAQRGELNNAMQRNGKESIASSGNEEDELKFMQRKIHRLWMMRKSYSQSSDRN